MIILCIKFAKFGHLYNTIEIRILATPGQQFVHKCSDTVIFIPILHSCAIAANTLYTGQPHWILLTTVDFLYQ